MASETCRECYAEVRCGECGAEEPGYRPPAVPDPTVEALSEAEQGQIREAMRGYAFGPMYDAVGRILAARAAAPDALTAVCSQCGERSSAMVKIGTTDGWCTACLDEAAEPAPDALRVAVEAALADSRNQWWHTGGTPCIPRRVIRALLDDPALAGRATGGER